MPLTFFIENILIRKNTFLSLSFLNYKVPAKAGGRIKMRKLKSS